MRHEGVVVFLCVVACGGGGSVSLEDLGSETERALCEFAVRCGLAPTAEACEAALFVDEGLGSLIAAVDRGTVEYDAEAAAACLDARSSAACRLIFEADPEDPCADVFTGTVPDGGECYLDEECLRPEGGDADCVVPDTCTEACCLGACVQTPADSLVAAGDDCAGPDGELPCVDGHYCATTDTGSTCEPKLAPGEDCNDFDACSDGAFCNITDFVAFQGTCYVPAEPGEACDPEVFFADFACVDVTTFCDATARTCQPRPDVGEACGADIPCLPLATCDGTACVARGEEGDSCGVESDDCLLDLECVSEGTGSGTCQPPPADEVCPAA